MILHSRKTLYARLGKILGVGTKFDAGIVGLSGRNFSVLTNHSNASPAATDVSRHERRIQNDQSVLYKVQAGFEVPRRVGRA